MVGDFLEKATGWMRRRQRPPSIEPDQAPAITEEILREKIQEAEKCLAENIPLNIQGGPEEVDKVLKGCLASFQTDEETMVLDMRIPSLKSEEERVSWAKEGFIPQVKRELQKLEPDFSFGRLKQLPLSGELAKMLDVFLDQHGDKKLLMAVREADNFSSGGAFLVEFVRNNFENPRLNFILGRESGRTIGRGHSVEI